MNSPTSYTISIPNKYWTTTKSGERMLEYEEMAQLKIQIARQDALIAYLEKIRLVAIQALEAIEESGVANIAGQAMEELRDLEKLPNG